MYQLFLDSLQERQRERAMVILLNINRNSYNVISAQLLNLLRHTIIFFLICCVKSTVGFIGPQAVVAVVETQVLIVADWNQKLRLLYSSIKHAAFAAVVASM